MHGSGKTSIVLQSRHLTIDNALRDFSKERAEQALKVPKLWR